MSDPNENSKDTPADPLRKSLLSGDLLKGTLDMPPSLHYLSVRHKIYSELGIYAVSAAL